MYTRMRTRHRGRLPVESRTGLRNVGRCPVGRSSVRCPSGQVQANTLISNFEILEFVRIQRDLQRRIKDGDAVAVRGFRESYLPGTLRHSRCVSLE